MLSLFGPPTTQVDSLHYQIEAVRMAFEDARDRVGDTEDIQTDLDYLLDESRIHERVKSVFKPNAASSPGTPVPTNCTVSFQVADSLGNAVSFVNSNYMGFGTGLVPKGLGFTLQNRAAGLSLVPGHPNEWGKSKRSYHTIIPAVITEDGTDGGVEKLHATISNMGGFMQPQGHLQLMLKLSSGMDPQQAVDEPRFCIPTGLRDGEVMLEDGFEDVVVEGLIEKGHKVKVLKGYDRTVFGRAQIIVCREDGVKICGSDGRCDGCAGGG
jgi:gamma-glutamyltranspeptidase / glutathione hydrolase